MSVKRKKMNQSLAEESDDLGGSRGDKQQQGAKLVWPEYIIQKYNYPYNTSYIPNIRKGYPNCFSRPQISKVLGGSCRPKTVFVSQDRDRPYRCRWYKCMKMDPDEPWNPYLPQCPGSPGADFTFEYIEREDPTEKIPVFCKRGDAKWEYVRHYTMICRKEDHIDTFARQVPAIKEMLAYWLRNSKRVFQCVKPLLEERGISTQDLGSPSLSDDTIEEWFQSRDPALKAYWIYLIPDHYDTELYRLLNEARGSGHAARALANAQKKTKSEIEKTLKKAGSKEMVDASRCSQTGSGIVIIKEQDDSEDGLWLKDYRNI